MIDEAEDKAAAETEHLLAEEEDEFDDGLAVLSIEPREDPLLSEDENPEAYADLPGSKYGEELNSGSCGAASEDTLKWALYDNNADGTEDCSFRSLLGQSVRLHLWRLSVLQLRVN